MGQFQILPLGFLCNYSSYFIGQGLDLGVLALTNMSYSDYIFWD